MRGMLRTMGGKAAPAVKAAKSPARVSSGLSDKERLAMLDAFEQAEIGWFWATDADHRLIYLSQSAIDKLGEREVLGAPLASLIEPVAVGDDEGTERPVSFMLGARSRLVDLTVRLQVPGGEGFWLLTGTPQFKNDTFLGYRGSAKDITSIYAQQRDASRLSQYDSLTGLANRYRMAKRLSSILTAYRSAKRSCALLMLDLDRFKSVNDTLGHPAGDELLKQVADRLGRILPATAEIGRIGGDEFQVILPDIDDRGELGELAQRVIQMVSQPYAIEDGRAIIGTSVGIAIAPYDGVEPDELIKSADLALYAGKSGGRGQYRFYSNDLKDSADERREIEEDLRDALSRNEIELRYQPVVRASDNIVVGFEALLRWTHPRRGTVSPAVFIPIAEETGLINQLGEWALLRACEEAAQWPGNLRVAVNVSATQFSNDALPKLVNAALIQSGLDPYRLELEITESVFMGDAYAVDRTFARLKKIGVKLSLDDFGTGYSSLGYLRKAPFDKIKIDQGFVRGCTSKRNSNSAIITAIVSLAGALGMETTAEGVEALDELAMVAKLGATSVQGYVFSGAVTHEEVLAKLNSDDAVYRPVGPTRYRAERRSLFRTIGVIHEDHRYEVVLRNLSRTGAMIEGLLEIPLGTELVVDLGEGQLAVGTVRRSHDTVQGVEFESPLISDGADGLCTRHRISPYVLAAAGMPLRALPSGNYAMPEAAPSRPRFMQVSTNTARAA